MKFYRLSYKAKNRIEKRLNEDGDCFEELFSGMPDEISKLSDGNVFAFISGYSVRSMCIAAAVKSGEIDGYIDAIKAYIPEYVYDEADIEEITCDTFCDVLNMADRLNEFDEHRVRRDLDILPFGNRNENISFQEEFIGKTTVKYHSSDLDEEIARVRKTERTESGYNPVHYIIGGNSYKIRKNMVSVLLNELYANGRLNQKRYTFVSVENYHYSISSLEFELRPFFRISQGGTVVFDIKEDIADSGERRSYVKDLLSDFCALAGKYVNDTLCIFLLPDNSEKSASEVCRMMPGTAFVKISEDALSTEKAKKYLSSCAKADGIRAGRSLYADVKKGSTYYIHELDEIYGSWYRNAIVNRNFPAYAGFVEQAEAQKAEVKNEKPKGNAYDELMSMTGLEEAKKVINESIDYFKAQKMFADCGFGDSRPSMHMVFTGAPGTAKTTAARLFASIMKDNGVLSSGAFVEVGRADLVGRYVGWTAQIVKEKFKAAEGGVLFIDEAYSLVDDKGGMYGDEAINTIVQEMENRRDDVIVIFAGYADKMEEFLSRNPGLRSRIAFKVPFENYTSSELYEIAAFMAENDGLIFGDGVKEKLLPIMEAASMQSDFGNGRFVRNVMERARMKQSVRLVHSADKIVTREQIATLIPDDFEMPVMNSEKKEPAKVIGF